MVKIVVIGASSAGISAVKSAKNVAADSEVTLFGKEGNWPYFRPYLTEYLGNDSVVAKPDFYLNRQEWYQNNGINFKFATSVVQIDPKNKTLLDSKNCSYNYDKLIIAAGANPFVPIPKAIDLDFVFTLRTLEDAKKIKEYASKIKKIAIIGSGLIGLEAAWAFSKIGKDVTVIELAERILPKQLDQEGSAFLSNIINTNNVKILTNKMAENIVSDNGLNFILFKDGTKLETELVLLSIGIRSNTALAKEAGIAAERGILINEKCETSIPDIYACGDAAQFNATPALWMPAMKMGNVAGTNAAGGNAHFLPDTYPVATNAFGSRLFALGQFQGDELTTFSKHEGNVFRKLFFHSGKLCGGIIFNDPKINSKILEGIKNQTSQEEIFSLLKF